MFKHLDLNDRSTIMHMLDSNSSVSKIAAVLGRGIGTVTREIVRNRTLRKELFDFNQCRMKFDCRKQHVCGDHDCSSLCKHCDKCNRFCSDFTVIPCATRDSAPHCCNGCSRVKTCRNDKYFYTLREAHEKSRKVLSGSRQVICLSEKELQELDSVVTQGIRNGLSPYCITVVNNLPVSCSTMYRYFDKGILTVRNIDLQRKVRFKVKYGRKATLMKPTHRVGRDYQDYLEYCRNHPDVETVQMDIVEGTGKKHLLTLTFVNSNLVIAILLPDKTQKSVQNALDTLEARIGRSTYARMFRLILTDNGPEFLNFSLIEMSPFGTVRSHLFYCDPYSSWQKGVCEVNHVQIRRILPKGMNFDMLTQAQVNTAMSNVNSYPRRIFQGKAPLDMVSGGTGKVLGKIGITQINPDAVRMTPLKLSR